MTTTTITTTDQPQAAGGLPDEVTRLVARSRANALGNVLRRSAARHGAKTALIDGDRQFTFAQFDQVADDVAASLERDGITPGTRVALLSRNCWEFAALAWGCARLGAVLVPVNFMLTADEVAFLLGDAEISALFTGADLAATAAAALDRSGVPARLRVVIRGGDPADGGSTPGWPAPRPAGPPPSSPMTTWSGSCTPAAPSPGRRAPCCRPGRCWPSTSAAWPTAR